MGGGSSVTPGKLCNFYPHLSLPAAFPALNVPQNFYIMTFGSPTQQIYPVWKTVLTIWQNMKGREKIPIFQLFSDLGKTWKYSKILIFNLFHELGTNNNSSHDNIQKSQFSISFNTLTPLSPNVNNNNNANINSNR